MKAPAWAWRLAVIAALFVAWEIAARVLNATAYLPAPSHVIASLGELLAVPGVGPALLTTLGEVAAGFTFSLMFGGLFGLLIGWNGLSRRSGLPIMLLLYATPQVTILPLFILYFGIGPAAKIAFGASHGMFPVMLAVVTGMETVRPDLLRAAEAMGASRGQRFLHVVLPSILPGLFTAMRVAMSAVLLGVLLAELYVSQSGIGFFARQFGQGDDPTNLFGLTGLVAAIAILLNTAVGRAESALAIRLH